MWCGVFRTKGYVHWRCHRALEIQLRCTTCYTNTSLVQETPECLPPARQTCTDSRMPLLHHTMSTSIFTRTCAGRILNRWYIHRPQRTNVVAATAQKQYNFTMSTTAKPHARWDRGATRLITSFVHETKIRRNLKQLPKKLRTRNPQSIWILPLLPHEFQNTFARFTYPIFLSTFSTWNIFQICISYLSFHFLLQKEK